MRPDPPGAPENWGGISATTYGLLPADGSLTVGELDVELAQLVARRVPPDQKAKFTVTIGAVPLQKIPELRLDAALFGATGKLTVANALFGLGLLVLVVACLNYANLATAQAVGRAREIGMRKILGAGRFEILLQSWIEASLSTIAALFLAGLFLWLTAPVMAAQTDIDALGPMTHDPVAITSLAGIAVAVSLASGLYPALIAWRVRPVDALRAGAIRTGPRGVAQFLIGLQFATASALLIVVIVVNQQNAHVRNLAFQKAGDQVVVLPRSIVSGIPIETLRQQLSSYPQIKAVGEAQNAPWSQAGNWTKVARSPDSAAFEQSGRMLNVGYGYFAVYGQNILAGRVHEPGRDDPAPQTADSATPRDAARAEPVVIDLTYSRQLGFPSPEAAIGQRLYFPSQGERPRQRPLEVIGVVEDQPLMLQSVFSPGTVYDLRTDNGAPPLPNNLPLVRISATGIDSGLAAINRVWSQLAPNMPLEYQFSDQIFEQNFRVFERVSRLFQALSVLAFLISSVGLFGMAVHVTQRRMHEIGVRKTLGSSAGGVIGLLLTDFSKPVIIANFLAWPIAWWAAQAYLQPFLQRIDIGPAHFFISLGATLLIAWIAVGGQTLRAANIRPVEVLRQA